MEKHKTPTFNALAFFEHLLAGTKNNIEIRAIHSKSGEVKNIFTRDISELQDFIAREKDSRNIYFGTATRDKRRQSGKKEDVREVVMLWADQDFKNYQGGEAEALEKLRAFPLRPSCVVRSGNGFHNYWFLKNAIEPSGEIERILRGIAEALHSDPAVCDLSRVMRVPNTYNLKDGGKKPVAIAHQGHDRYSLADFEPYELTQAVICRGNGNRELSEVIADINSKCDFLKMCFEDSSTLAEPLWYSEITNLIRYPHKPLDLCHAYSQKYPKYNPAETERKARHALNDTGPHTCETIKGYWDCGKNCGVKSPIVKIGPQGAQATPVEWQDPIPLEDFSILPVFPVELLPDPGADMVQAVASVNQIDPSLAGSIYLAELSTCLSKKVVIDLGSHIEQPNLFICGVLPSGERKSSTLDVLTRPIYEYQKKKTEDMAATVRETTTAHRLREARLAKIVKKAASTEDANERMLLEREAVSLQEEIDHNPPVKPPQYIADDVTPEKLGELMADNGERIGIISSEGGIFEILGGRYSDKIGNFDLPLKAHSGDAWFCHRIGRESQAMDKPSLTMMLTVQPIVIERLGENRDFQGRGLLARFLYAVCVKNAGRRQRQTKKIDERVKTRYQAHIFALMNLKPYEGQLRMSREGQEVWDGFYNEIEAELNPRRSLEGLEDWGSKLPGAVARIAGLLHIAEHGERDFGMEIQPSTVASACAIGAFYKEHALAAFGMMRIDPRIEAARRILDYLKTHRPDTFKGRDVLANKNAFKTMADLDPGIRVLIERGYIREIDPPEGHRTSGRPEAKTYEVHPQVKNSNAKKSPAIPAKGGL